MEDAAPQAVRRSVTSVDLGEMKGRVVALSAAAGVGPSTWLRELVRREVEGAAISGAEPGDALVQACAAKPVYRAWLDANLTAGLDEVARRGGFRNRTAALRALVKGVSASSAASSTGEAVRALGVSNHQLVVIGRNVNQIAKALHAAPGKTTAAERIELEEAVRAIHRHLDLAARLVGELRPMLKTGRAEA